MKRYEVTCRSAAWPDKDRLHGQRRLKRSEHDRQSGKLSGWQRAGRGMRNLDIGGEAGIRTLGTLLGYNALAKRRFRPLSHLTKHESPEYSDQDRTSN